MKRRAVLTPILCIWVATLLAGAGAAGAKVSCKDNTVYANVVALDQPISINRLGAAQPGGMIFALARDVCAVNGKQAGCAAGPLTAGQVMLKPYKRPRPMVLRVNQGQCLQIGFTNLLNSTANATYQPSTRAASVHVQGLEWVNTTQGTASTCKDSGGSPDATCNDGSWVGQNPNGLVSPITTSWDPLADAPQTTYTLYAAQEGAYLLYSTGDVYSKVPSVNGSAGDGGQLEMGLFGAVHVEPAQAKWYRSQVNADDLALASKKKGRSHYRQPLIDYAAVYPDPTGDCFATGACRTGPVLRLTCSKKDAANKSNHCRTNEIVHSDLTAIIAGPTGGRFPPSLPETPTMRSSYSLPDRLQPFREFTIIYHEMFNSSQAFADYYNIQNSQGNLVATGNGEGQDQFGINYGMAGIGSEVLANRLGLGPMADCTTCKFEEFFLTSWAVGDPAMVVDNPADPETSGGVDQNCTMTGACQVGGASCNTNGGSACTSTCDTSTKLCSDGKTACTQDTDCQTCLLTSYTCTSTPATKAFFPDDPSNVYHSYISDHTKFRILHGGSDLHHVHHQHAHQWLHSPDTSNGDYLDSQSIGPGSAFTLEMTYNASGNVNQTVGDSIFHCHFYPHFAGGMWSLWRTHDVYETGTLMNADGTVKTGVNRALPDGEIAAGTPIPALVPVPTIPMPPMPSFVQLASDDGGTVVEVCDSTSTGTQCNNPVSVLSPKAGAAAQYANPGFPFFIPGIAGQRAPHPPLDFAYACSDDPGQTCTPAISGVAKADVRSCKNPATARCEEKLDGGLPRHMILACPQGETCTEIAPLADYTDFSKTITEARAFELPEDGTFVEKVAMKYHSQRLHPSVTPENHKLTHNAWQHPPLMRKADFVLNGLPQVAGAPFADPCIEYTLDGGRPPWHDIRHYKAADIQFDFPFNQEGWHFPQTRILSLWGDVAKYLNGERAPEPFFFRANSGDCIEYVLANLVPNVYEVDDFQVRTPTDIIGQHIHLVKFDVTSSDGATNGFNYEDGTLAPNEVTERIVAINKGGNGLFADFTMTGTPKPLTAKYLPFFGPGPGGRWMGGQATVQRWYTDRLFDGTIQKPGVDRTLRTVFTHDHFGPSTHQQAGLYAGLVIEPEDSQWFFNDAGPTDPPFGGDVGHHPLPSKPVTGYNGNTTRDGGPTTWQAVIVPENNKNSSFREFLFEFQDTTLTYEKFGTEITAPPLSQGFCQDDPTVQCTPSTAQNFNTPNDSCSKVGKKGPCIGYGFCSTGPTSPASAVIACNPATGTSPENVSMCPGYNPNGCSEYASVCPTCNFIAGVPSSNVANTSNPPFVSGSTWPTTALDAPKSIELITLSNASNSFSINYRNEPLFLRIDDDQGNPKTGQGGKEGDLSYAYSSTVHGDPFTLLLQAYAGDDVQVRTLVGAHINPHNFTIYGNKWLEEPSFVDSGWRTSQEMGISEHFEEVFRLPAVTGAGDSDYLYMAGAAAIEQAGGSWGLLRAYAKPRADLKLKTLPQNSNPATAPVCPSGAKQRNYTVAAFTAKQAFSNQQLVYNARGTAVMGDPNAILYFDTATLSCSNLQDPSTCSLPIACNQGTCSNDGNKSCVNPSDCVGPLVLRANAGDCMNVTLFNMIPQGTVVPGASSPVSYCGSDGTSACTSSTSTNVGLHPQLVSYDVTKSDGFNAGKNPDQVVAYGSPKTYQWYAGNVDPKAGAGKQHIPIEFGAANLLPSDTLNQYQYGLFGALVIEPEGSTCDGQPIETCTGTTAFIRHRERSFREFVLITQDGLQGPSGPSNFTFQTAKLGGDKANAVNYRFEPLNTNNITRTCTTGDVSCVLSNTAQCCSGASNNACTFTTCGEPQTPIFQACAGEQVRFRVLHGGGINTNQVFELHGHSWQEQPYLSHGKGCQTPTTQTNLHSSSKIGVTNGCNPIERDTYSEYQGARMGHGPGNHFDVLIERAGGIDQVPGDYLYRTYPAEHFRLGLWGVFRVLGADDQACRGAYGQGTQGAGATAAGGGR